MDKKSLVLLLITSSFVTTSFATNIMNKLIGKPNKTTHSVMSTNKTTRDRDSYTDFTGTWVGDCGYGTVTLDIKNDESYISFDGFGSKIGHGVASQALSDEEWNNSESYSFEWNTDGSELIWKGVNFHKYNDEDNSAFKVDINKYSLTLKNNQLNIDGAWTNFEDITQVNPPTAFHCVFSKK